MSRIHFNNLTAVGFEEFCFDLLHRVGFSNLDWRKGTPKNSSPADSGRDIVAYQRREDVDGDHSLDVWFVDCKHYRKAVPPTELQNALAWAEAESPNVLLFVASGYFSNPAKDYLEKYRQSRKPRFRIKTWEKPQLERVIGGRRSLLYEYNLIKESHKIRSLQQIRRAENEYFDKIWYGRRPPRRELNKYEPKLRAHVKRSMREIEKKYGKNNLYVDDFGWGMFSGKVSALRWVLGDEWDMLDS
jgi:hypothetical protein